MSRLDTLRIHAQVEEINVLDDQTKQVKIRLDWREDIQGECLISAIAVDAKAYFLGQELCGIGSYDPLPPHMRGLRLNACIEKVSAPFNDGHHVEIRIAHEPPDADECRLRVGPRLSPDYQIGREVYFLFSPLGNPA